MIVKVSLVLALTVAFVSAAFSPERCMKIMKATLCLAFHSDSLDGCKDGIEVNVDNVHNTVCLNGSDKCKKTVKKCVNVLHPQMVNLNKD